MKKSVQTAKWDAELNTDVCDPYNNADLTITLKIGFRQINPSGGAAEGTYHDYGDATETARKIIKWTPASWKAWTNRLCQEAERFWHGKFWLLNNFDHLTYTVRGVTYRPNIWCRFKVVNAHVPEIGPIDAHHVIEAVRLHKDEKWFGSHSTLYDSRDVNWAKKRTDSKGNRVMQKAHVHEVGHLLGLGHVDEGKAHCPKAGDTNAAACYGVSDRDMKSVMGSGMGMRKDFADPWRRAIVKLTSKGSAASAGDWKAEMKRHYPRTPPEVAANKAITSRPVRK